MKARAVWFTAKQRAELLPVDVRMPGDDDILVQTLASGVSHGTEMTAYRGQVPSTQTVAPAEIMEGSFSFPLKFGYQVVGRVVEAGKNTPYREGDLVFVHFPHQDWFTVNVSLPNVVYRLPEYERPEIGVLSALLNVAVNVMLDVPIRVGEVVAVFGQGVVGMFCAQLARRTAGKVVVIDPIPLRRELAQRFGADAAVAPEAAAATVAELSEGRGADVVIEASGAPAALQTAIEVAAFEGTVVVPSWYGSKPLQLVLSPEFHMRRLRLVSSQVNVVGSGLQPRWTMARRMGVVMELLPTLHPEEMITHRIPFERAPDGYQLIDQHPDQVLAVVFEYEGAH